MPRAKNNKKQILLKLSPIGVRSLDDAKPPAYDRSTWVEFLALQGLAWWREAVKLNPTLLLPPDHIARPAPMPDIPAKSSKRKR